jgi:hypothetical protein
MPQGDVGSATVCEGTVKGKDGLRQVALTEGKTTETVVGINGAAWMRSRFRNPYRLLRVPSPLNKPAERLQTVGYPGMRANGTKYWANHTYAFIESLTGKEGHVLSEGIQGLMIIAQGIIYLT